MVMHPMFTSLQCTLIQLKNFVISGATFSWRKASPCGLYFQLHMKSLHCMIKMRKNRMLRK